MTFSKTDGFIDGAKGVTIGAIILGMMALHYGLERRHQAGT